jgi:uncharacterized protein (DUF4415 family)
MRGRKNKSRPQAHASVKRATTAGRAKGAGKKGGKTWTIMAVAEQPKRSGGGSKSRPAASLQNMRISDLYRPLKRPITVRVDADVLAWFKKDGRRYQTRINRALRSVMEKEMKNAGGR